MENKRDRQPHDKKGQPDTQPTDPNVIPVMEEFVTVDKKVVETGKVYIKKRVVEEEATINIPLIQEGYKVERVPVKNQVYDEPPVIRHEGGNMFIPIIREVVKVIKRYEVVEELHVIKTKTEVPHMQQITLLKENVEVERVPTKHSSE